jgi:hypothetical protein
MIMEKRIWLGFVIAALLIVGCNMPQPAPGQTAGGAVEIVSTPDKQQSTIASPLKVEVTATTQPATQTPSAPRLAARDECGNPYYPIADGATWTYRGPDGEFTHTMTTGTGNSFSINIVASVDTFLIEGICSNGDINLMEIPGTSLSHTGESEDFTMTTVSNEGVTLPGDIQEGDRWTQTLEVDVEVAGQVTNVVMPIHYEATGYETVSVLAGTFSAIKIEQSIESDGVSSKIQTLWYAQDIGMVKSEVEVSDGVTVIELVDYILP